MKTLEELGFKIITKNSFNILFLRSLEHSLLQHINLFADGDYTISEGKSNDDMYLLVANQELHKAIENEMKELGWWK